MRPIKFRAKDWYGRWCYGTPVLPMKYDGPKCLFAYDFVEGSQYKKWDKKHGETTVLKSTVCQFTGTYDKNGKEIYEGDIVSSGATTGIVVYDCEQAGFVVQKEKSIELRFYSLLGIEVIGNIHDNPEILEK